MPETIKTADLPARIFVSATVLIRQYGRVLLVWSCEPDVENNAVMANGKVVFGGPPAPDVGDDIATWCLSTADVEIISEDELREMEQAKAADEAARPVFGLGERGEIVVAPDGSTVLRAEDMPDLNVMPEPGVPTMNLLESGDPTLAYRRARGVVKGDEPAEDIIRRLRDGVDAPSAQLSMRRRTLATFCRDYSEAFEQGDEDMLPILEGTLQLVLRRVVEVTDP